MDEWLYVLRWTTAKSREASPALFVARAVFSVIHGLFVVLRCLAIWWGVDWLMTALESPQQSRQMLTRLALLAGGLLATEAVGRQIAYWLGSRARFHLELLLRREFIAKSSELDLVEIEAAGQRDLLRNRHALEYTVCASSQRMHRGQGLWRNCCYGESGANTSKRRRRKTWRLTARQDRLVGLAGPQYA